MFLCMSVRVCAGLLKSIEHRDKELKDEDTEEEAEEDIAMRSSA